MNSGFWHNQPIDPNTGFVPIDWDFDSDYTDDKCFGEAQLPVVDVIDIHGVNQCGGPGELFRDGETSPVELRDYDDWGHIVRFMSEQVLFLQCEQELATPRRACR